MKKQTGHTPTPWIFKEGYHNNSMIYSENAELISVFQDDNKANAQFIVKACNAHEELVKALKKALDIIENEYPECQQHEFDCLRQALKKAEA